MLYYFIMLLIVYVLVLSMKQTWQGKHRKAKSWTWIIWGAERVVVVPFYYPLLLFEYIQRYSNICLTNENCTLTFSWLLKRMTNRILRNLGKYSYMDTRVDLQERLIKAHKSWPKSLSQLPFCHSWWSILIFGPTCHCM